ncbi:hypothetical protein [Anaeromyxobacter terrae]|uniref:hypothetical protein n=1 Tax=Anaeromyxobacter terrae TaxID=2925406 RepID=UPI001F57A7FE|nr:hypothetical protein [Anaeromyxobacter sp. SG22]
MFDALVMSAMVCATAGSFSLDPAPARPVHATLHLDLDAPAAPIPSAPGDLALHPAGLLAGERARDGSDELSPRPDDARVRSLRRWERALKWSTAGALLATSTLGTLVAINQPTAFGDGRCQTGHPVLGTYGCDRGLSTLHGTSGVLSATLYTANGVLALSIPGPVGRVSPAERPWHRALTYVHLGGIAVQPLLGLVAAFPQVIGVRNEAPGDRFPRNIRTAHVSLGYVIAAAYLATLALEQ